ncbi:NAD(P)/FAD-dependent oxidoreductase [Thalassotalea euphylliae]|uniref:NAD(P)/FAD-dependent oxidoreductase n=1 Tax=Thalassotalea euphylliae TaxID=1655234 RepID=UPI0036308A53
MSNMHTAQRNKVAVIGAGIIGVNCAVAIAKRGYEVTLFDGQGIGQQCSFGNAGHFATEQVFPLASASMLPQLPKFLLDKKSPLSIVGKDLPTTAPWLTRFLFNMLPSKYRHATEALKQLNASAIACYQELLQEAQAEELMTLNGSLLVFEQTPIGEIETLQRQFSEQGVKVKLLTKRQALALEADLHDGIRYALHFTDVSHTINPQKLCHVLAEYAQSLGAIVIERDVIAITAEPDKVSIKTSEQTHAFDSLVIATGAYSKPLAKQLGYRLPMQAERGYHFQLAAHATLSRPIASAERKFIMTPMSAGLRLAGTVEYAKLETPPNYQRASMLEDHAKHILKSLPEPIDGEQKNWMGARPSLPDSLPVICQGHKHQNVYFAAGHHHLGLTQGAITGKLIAQLIAGERTDIDISAFNIKRFN